MLEHLGTDVGSLAATVSLLLLFWGILAAPFFAVRPSQQRAAGSRRRAQGRP